MIIDFSDVMLSHITSRVYVTARCVYFQLYVFMYSNMITSLQHIGIFRSFFFKITNRWLWNISNHPLSIWFLGHFSVIFPLSFNLILVCSFLKYILHSLKYFKVCKTILNTAIEIWNALIYSRIINFITYERCDKTFPKYF